MAPDTELYLFSAGTLAFAGGIQVPVPFFLIRHPQGHVLVDGGSPVAVVHDRKSHWGPLASEFEVRMSSEDHCLAQLGRLGIAPESVSHVVQTHLHMDHTGALGHFPQAATVVHARELEAARAAPAPVGPGYVHADYDRPELRWQLVQSDADLFGDGVIRLIETPGHTAGHMSLLLTLRETGAIVLTADAVDNRAQWDGRMPLRAIFSREQASRSLERLRALADETGALVVFGHDPSNWSQLEHPPVCYA